MNNITLTNKFAIIFHLITPAINIKIYPKSLTELNSIGWSLFLY